MPSSSPPPPERLSPTALLRLALGFGLAVGLSEAAPLALAVELGIRIRMSPQFVWMTPVGDTLLFLLVGSLLVLAGRRRPTLTGRRVALGVFVGLGVLCLGLIIESIYDLAVLVLAIGVGAQMARTADGRVGRWLTRVVPRAAPALALVVLLLGLGVRWRTAAGEEARLAALPEPEAGTPNILLLILDTVRASSLELYGGRRTTAPHLDSLARRGVVFDEAMSASPWTFPSHATLFTGMWPFQVHAGWEAPLGDEFPTLAEALASDGYATGGFVGNILNASSMRGLSRGFAHYEDYVPGWGELILSTSVGRALAYSTRLRWLVGVHELLNRKHGGDVNRAFLSWLADEKEDHPGRPWFAFLNYYDAHEPHSPPDTLLSWREWNDFEHLGGIAVGNDAWVADKWTMPGRRVALHTLSYEAAIRRADAAMGRLFRELDARGELQNTVVVVLSDHGEQLGERGLFEHNNSLYLPTLHVPLIIAWPGRVPAGVRVDETVSLRDVPATILGLSGSVAALPGTSLAPLWRTTDEGAPPVPRSPAIAHLTRGYVEQPGTPISLGQTPEMHSIVDMPYQYIHNGDGTDELYDVGQDPGQGPNLAGTPAGDSILVRLRAVLYREVTGELVPEGLPVYPASPRLPGPR